MLAIALIFITISTIIYFLLTLFILTRDIENYQSLSLGWCISCILTSIYYYIVFRLEV